MRVIYGADYFKPTLPDEEFRPEARSFQNLGFGVSTVDLDLLAAEPAKPKPEVEGTAFYRGWMLDTRQYSNLVAGIEASGGSPLTSKDEYLLTHHIPNWVKRIADLTPETVVLPNGSDFEGELRSLGWAEFFVKDYVKSLKTSMGSRITDPSDIGPLVAEMVKFRGTIEGGLCIRRVETLRPEAFAAREN